MEVPTLPRELGRPGVVLERDRDVDTSVDIVEDARNDGGEAREEQIMGVGAPRGTELPSNCVVGDLLV